MPIDEMKVAITADTAEFRREMIGVAQVSDRANSALEKVAKTAGGLMRGRLSGRALIAGLETLTQASASPFATIQFVELAA